MHRFESLMERILAPAAEGLFQGFHAIPMSAVKALFVVLLLSMTLWVITLTREATDPATGRRYPLFRDLRLWAVLILLTQALLYGLLG